MMKQLPIILSLIVGQAWLCLSNAPAWDCSKYYEKLTYTRQTYCYILSESSEEPISLEGKDPLLMNTSTSRNNVEKVLFCARAAKGRGYRYFSLLNGKCNVGGTFSSYFCSYSSLSGCTNSAGYPCVRGTTSTSCLCGTSGGYGASNYYNRYYVTSYASTLGFWIEVEDVFNNTVEMFNKTSPKYINLYDTYKSAIQTYLNDSKICGITSVSAIANTHIRPKDGPGPILMSFRLYASFFNSTILHEKLKHFPYPTWNITEFSTRQISGSCFEKASVLSLDIAGGNSFTSPVLRKRSGFYITYTVRATCVTPNFTKVDLKLANISKDEHISNFTTLCSTVLVNRGSLSGSCYVSPFSVDEALHYVIGEAKAPGHPTMHGFDYIFINVTKGDLLAVVTEPTGCVHVLGSQTYLNGSGSYDSNYFRSDLEAVSYPNDLRYTWFCYKSGDGLTVPQTPTEARSFPVVESGVSISGKSGGCFGSGPGRLKVTTRATYFESSTLAAAQTLYFRLFVEKGDRFSFVSKTCSVAAAPAKYNVRCKFNCGPLVKTTARLGLQPYCDDPAGCSILLNHSWKFFVDTGRKIDNGNGTCKYFVDYSIECFVFDVHRCKERSQGKVRREGGEAGIPPMRTRFDRYSESYFAISVKSNTKSLRAMTSF